VEAEIATRVSASIAKLTAILPMHAESGNVFRRGATTMNAFASSAGSQATAKSIALWRKSRIRISHCSFRRKLRKWRFRFEERREGVAAAR